MASLAQILTPDLLLAALLLLGAGMVRGFTGFGAALLLAPILALLFGVTGGIAIIVLLNVIVAVQLMPAARRASSFGAVGWLTAAACVTSPIGAWMLVSIDPDLLRRTISGLVLASCAMIALSGREAIRIKASRSADIAAGGLGGILNGLGGIGGPPIMLYWIAQRNSAESLRANVILSFAIIHTVTGLTFALHGLLDAQTILRTLLLMPSFLIGAWIGTHYFVRSSEQFFFRLVMILLSVVALATMIL